MHYCKRCAVRKYADAMRPEGPSRWWGNGEPVFINATYRNQKYVNEGHYPGKIRNITFDHIYLKAECSAFFAGEENTRIENVRMEDFCITMCKQGTQDSGFFDEQPSLRDVYPHKIPGIYARSVDGLYLKGEVRFVEPYSLEKNGLIDTEDCSKILIELNRRLPE